MNEATSATSKLRRDKMSKVKTIKAFASKYQNWNFKDQMYAMNAIAQSLNLHMFFYANVTNGACDNTQTNYQFQTMSGRNLLKITLTNSI
jgi:hypothetical protein